MWNYLLDLALVCHPLLAYLSTKYPKMGITDSRKHFFYFSFLAILALRYSVTARQQPLAHITTNHDLTLNINATTTPIIEPLCASQTQPNPIAQLYPNNATGVLNGTVSLLPIPLSLARQLIPAQYRILEHAYRAILPGFPRDMYPAVLQAVHDHEVQAFGYKIPDFSRAGLEFPFLDLLADNTTSFKWAPAMLMTASNAIALSGAQDYGTVVYPAAFDPPCDAYRSSSPSSPGTTTFSASSANTSLHTTFHPAPHAISTPLSFFANVTNQPTFADGRTCDNMIRLFGTPLSTGANGIEEVTGHVQVKGVWPLEGSEEKTWEGVEGVRFASAFVENNYLDCEGFRGYDGSGLE